MLMKKQGGWVGLMPYGLIAIAITGLTATVVETNVNKTEAKPAEAVLMKSEPKLREGVVTHEMEEAKSPVGVPGQK